MIVRCFPFDVRSQLLSFWAIISIINLKARRANDTLFSHAFHTTSRYDFRAYDIRPQQSKRALLNTRQQAKRAHLSPSSRVNMILMSLFKCKLYCLFNCYFRIFKLTVEWQFLDSY